jgi:hypothetical protein
MTPPDRSSCDLLRAIARQRTDVAKVNRLAAQVRDWNSLIALAQEHRVLPMLFLKITDSDAVVPPEAMELLRAGYNRNMLRALANAAELIAVLAAFNDARIPAMPFKGVVLAASAYHDLTVRPAGDLDLLIEQQHAKQAKTILLERGFVLETEVRADGMPAHPYNFEFHFERPTDGMVLELRWRFDLTQPRFRRDLGMDWVRPHRRTAMVAGAEVPDMTPEIKLLVLCMHGSKHIWSRLIWICDIAQLLESSPELDWKAVISESKRTGLWRVLRLGVLLAHQVAGAGVPHDVLSRLESDSTSRDLAKYIGENLFTAPGSGPPGRVPYNLRVLGFRDRMSLLTLLNLLQPNERDRAVFSLPKSLDALYYVIRPFRILWDRSARS